MAVGKASLKRAAKAAETEPKKEETKVAAEEKAEETFRNQWIFSLLLRIGDNGERSYLRTGSAGGRNSDKSDIIKTSYAGSKLTDGFG